MLLLEWRYAHVWLITNPTIYSPTLMQINKMRFDHLGKKFSMFQKHRVEQGFHFWKQSRRGYRSQYVTVGTAKCPCCIIIYCHWQCTHKYHQSSLQKIILTERVKQLAVSRCIVCCVLVLPRSFHPQRLG